jgi:hypothetical protein
MAVSTYPSSSPGMREGGGGEVGGKKNKPQSSLINRQLCQDRAWLAQMSLSSFCPVAGFDGK